MITDYLNHLSIFSTLKAYIIWADSAPRGGGALGYILGGYVPPGLQIGTPF